MKTVSIDGVEYIIQCCHDCPFYATECELGAECRFPCNPANNGEMFDWGVEGIRDDCPLRG